MREIQEAQKMKWDGVTQAEAPATFRAPSEIGMSVARGE